MKNIVKSRAYISSASVLVLMFTGFLTFPKHIYGYPTEMRQAMLSGPWEIVVQMGMDGSMMRFPVRVTDEKKAAKLDQILPMMRLPIKIRLMQYVPDLKWETSFVEEPKAGAVVQIKVKGMNLNQDIWLNSADPAKQSILSQVGGMKIVKLQSSIDIEKFMRELTTRKSIGVISVWHKDSNKPLEYIVNTGQTINLPISNYKLEILEYLPHFTVDTTTKKVSTLSNKPVNPAVKISLNDGSNKYEQWFWSKFPSSPHMKNNLPLRVLFTDFDIGNTLGNYILVTKEGSKPWLFYFKDEKKHAEQAKFKHEYPFGKNAYNFSIEQFSNSANIKTSWRNGSEELVAPAIIASIEENKTSKQLVLELDKPKHHRSASGTIVLLYRRQTSGSRAAK